MKTFKNRLLVTVITTGVSVLGFLTPSHADAPVVIKAPQISLLSVGGKIVATPAMWSQSTGGKFSWIINGKNVANLKNRVIQSPIKKGTVVQYKEELMNVTAFSNKIVIGSVAVNGFAKIDFLEKSNSRISVQIPKTIPANVKFSFQWFSGPFEVNGAKFRTYELASSDYGNEISLSITLSAKGFQSTNLVTNSLQIPELKREYKLLWSENFQEQSTLNPKIWKPENGDGTEYRNKGWGNQERQYYLASQVTLNTTDGLTINATRNGAEKYSCYYGKNCEWISSKYVSKGLVGFKYGRVEARIKGPVGSGSWGAFWMLGANIDERPWPGCGEIDITELLGREPNTVYGTPHGPASGQSNTTTIDSGIASDFHNYAIDWLPDQITWYLDGKAYGSLNKSSVPDPEHAWVFDHEYYLLMNLAMGGTFGGAIDSNLQSSKMSISWIKFSSINGVGEVIQH